ncbi:hypothetical protein PMAYCL1PPCAC_14906, partial [Pristionchus mayeri]
MGTTVSKPRSSSAAVYRHYSGERKGSTPSDGIHNVPNATTVTVAIRDVKTQMEISTRIDETLLKEKTESMTRVKILLLGGADAGKSTI